jgi:hypothetical protein
MSKQLVNRTFYTAFAIPVNNVALSKQEANNAPMTLVRPLVMPIMFANTAFSNRCIAMRTRHIAMHPHFHQYKQWLCYPPDRLLFYVERDIVRLRPLSDATVFFYG